jgi:hypothetical protein
VRAGGAQCSHVASEGNARHHPATADG